MDLFNNVVNMASNGRLRVNTEFEGIWKEAVVAYLEVTSGHLLGRTGERP
jgi:hypothetical protein